MNKSAATFETDIIAGNVEGFETMEYVEQNDVVKAADPDFKIYCTAIDLAEVVDSRYEVHGKAPECDDVVEVVDSKYETPGKACDDLVEVGESEYEIHVWACDSVVGVSSGVP